METDETEGSVTHWIGDLKAGGDQAAQALWQRYFERLARRARAQLGDAPRAVADEEDVALSAFDHLCRGAAAGRFPKLDNRDDLWRLLATITAQKAVDLRRRQGRRKRDAGRTRGEVTKPGGDAEVNAMAQQPDRGPSPEFVALMDEQYRHLLVRLGDDSLRQIAVWKMEGYSNEEIAQRLDCGLRTVERKLGVIRSIWVADAPA
jgi:DNA-directed RNA polymerase specialized sigma24 family protein